MMECRGVCFTDKRQLKSYHPSARTGAQAWVCSFCLRLVHPPWLQKGNLAKGLQVCHPDELQRQLCQRDSFNCFIHL